MVDIIEVSKAPRMVRPRGKKRAARLPAPQPTRLKPGKKARLRSYDQEAITPIEYSGLQEVYDHFNKVSRWTARCPTLDNVPTKCRLGWLLCS